MDEDIDELEYECPPVCSECGENLCDSCGCCGNPHCEACCCPLVEREDDAGE